MPDNPSTPELIERLRGLLAKATEPHPPCDNDSLGGRLDAIDIQNGNAATHNQWVRRIHSARLELIAALPLLLDQLESARASVPEGWQDIATAPRDGSYILALVAANPSERYAHLAGRAFVIRHEGKTPSDYDMGWAVFPGFGGVPDNWFTHWQPIPCLPSPPEPSAS